MPVDRVCGFSAALLVVFGFGPLHAQEEEAEAHYQRGNSLRQQGKLDDAAAEYRKAAGLRPDMVEPQQNLAGILVMQGKYDDAVLACRKVIAHWPKYARAHAMLGTALAEQGKLDEAVAANRRALALDPTDADAQYNLSGELLRLGRIDEGVAAARAAVSLRSNHADSYLNLGTGLRMQGKLDEAVTAYRKVATLRPDDVRAHCMLGHTLRQKGDFAAALAAFRRGQEVAPRGCPLPVAQFVKDTEPLARREAQLPDILSGKSRPDDAVEWMECARVCKAKRMYSAAARLFGDAFTAGPGLAEDLPSAHRYHAACSAALAAAGQGEDAALDESQRTAWSRKAREWLKDDLALCRRRKEGDGPPTLQQMLSHWQHDRDLSVVREPADLAKLPAAEREAWKQFWSEVATLLK